MSGAVERLREVPPCTDQPWLFDSTSIADHEIARAYCLGDDEQAPCPLLDACRSEYQRAEASALRDSKPSGTWAGELYGGNTRGQREHGTNRGYGQHRHHGEPACEPCRIAHNQVSVIQEARRKAEGRGRYQKRREARAS